MKSFERAEMELIVLNQNDAITVSTGSSGTTTDRPIMKEEDVIFP